MAIQFQTTILKFAAKGEKSGWSYLFIPHELAEQLNAGVNKSFRVKGNIDNYQFDGMNLLPMGDGNFILPLNASVRKQLQKQKGAKVNVSISLQKEEYQLDADFVNCLEDEPAAMDFFYTLARSHQNYFSKWIEAAKTEPTRVQRIATAIKALSQQMGYPEMIRSPKKKP
jgi:hypothetical protein